MEINKNSFKSKELLKQHDNGTEEPLSLELGSLPIKKYLVKNENRLCFTGKEKEGIQKLSKKIQFEMDSYIKEPISIFLNDKEVRYNPNSDKLTHYIKMKDEMITVPDIGNTQSYSDDESSKAEKIAERIHSFIINKTILEPKTPAPGIKCKTKYPREIPEEENNEFVFSDDEWVLEDNGQQLASIKRNKKDDHDKDPDGMGYVRNSSVAEISASTFANSNKSKTSQKDKQPSNDNNNKKKKGNIASVNIINILRLLICYSMVLALQEVTTFKDGNITVHSFLDTALLYKCKGDFYTAVPITRIEDNNIKLL
jgi:hypothetical protein